MRKTYSSAIRAQVKRKSSEEPEPDQNDRPFKIRKPMFSALETSQKVNTKPKAKLLKQSSLDLGQSRTKTCLQCRMSYVPSQTSDVELHKAHHKAFLKDKPTELSLREYSTLLNSVTPVWNHGTEQILRVGKSDGKEQREIASRLLIEANEDLGAVELDEIGIWMLKYQVFLYLSKRKCVGVLLCIPKVDAFKVKTVNFPITYDDKSNIEALVGISRIWTHKSMRRKNIATTMMEIVRQVVSFQKIPRETIAFSQPTEQGAKFARSYFGKDIDWLVYHDEAW